MEPAIGVGALVGSGIEHRANRAPQLAAGILRKRRTKLGFDVALIGFDDVLPIVTVELGVVDIATILLVRFEDVFEAVVIEREHDVAVHLDKPPIAVPGKSRVAAGRSQACNGLIVEAEI